ncbi:hypothetical protein EDD85DRAFT_1026432 [Armillaria nabsnona]|nr:hypothetical protein EDD85DRAFT_1026432 [Armillaria nabsnona]
MTMDFPRPVTLEDFLALVQTISSNAPLRRATSQSYRFAYTTWKVLEMETGVPVDRTGYAVRQGYPSGKNMTVGGGETPEKVKSQWEEAKVVMGQEFDASLGVSLTVILQKSRPYSNNPVAAYEPAIIGRSTEGAETRDLAPFCKTIIHIKTFNSGFCNCRTISP